MGARPLVGSAERPDLRLDRLEDLAGADELLHARVVGVERTVVVEVVDVRAGSTRVRRSDAAARA